ncbi:MAG: ABC-F family ATP-binding cassette domain-containing protein [Planctomycetota bacterium]|nr:ABC-F family ATP-binding cassette domain-containing protein [Planctomycetota bacterium]
MPLIAAANLRHSFGNTVILDGCSISIEAGDRIGVVGRNGTGKTTMLKALAGRFRPDEGEIVVQRGVRVGYLSQDPDLDPEETLKGAAEAGFAELHRLHNEQHDLYDQMAGLSGDALDKLMKRQAELERRIETLGGYAIDHKVEQILHGLGFTDAQFNVKVKGLSGGQKGRVALARLLLEQPDVLLLDEPTNHLDLDGRLWLEQFLKNEYPGAVLMISHDRYLLDRVVTRIVEVEQGRLIDYPGNYEAFREIRALRRLTQNRAYEKQQAEFRKQEEYIRRFKAGQRAKQAQGRLSRLETAKERAIERPMELSNLNMSLKAADRSGDIVVAARGVSKKFTNQDGSEKVLFRNLDMIIKRGERWAIIGPNGAGKSTLVSCILGLAPVDSGELRTGSSLRIGYYRQTHEHVPPDLTVWRYLQQVIKKENPGAELSEQAARNLAGTFLFTGDDQERDLGTLSGGERSRAVLAGLLASAKNLLILDEPTNHLDIPSAERLEEALSLGDEESVKRGGFDGTLILISHDRAFIDATCDHLLILDGQGNARVFTGNYADWSEKAEAERAEALARAADEKKRRDDAERRRRAAEEDKRRAGQTRAAAPANPFAKLKTDQLEQRIEKSQARIAEIDASMSDPAVWRDPVKCQKLGEERTRLVQELEPLEFEWLRRAEST